MSDTTSSAKPRKPLLLNAFTMNAVSHVAYGLWRHPRDQHYRHTDLDYWQEFGRLLDGSGFDNLFIADALGLLDTYAGNAGASLALGVQSPLTDPLLIASGIAAVTQKLGITITVSTTYEHPWLLARKFTTLDHVSDGRIGWNIVTSQLESAARNLGLDTQLDHDLRYDRADEFLDVAYKLWLSSWEDGAAVRDKGSEANPEGLFTDPAKVHPIDHTGRFFSVPGPFIAEPSPQRVPLLTQAGGSPRGTAFAARHAEVIFVVGADDAALKRNIERVKTLAAAEGRAPDAIKFVTVVSVVTGETDEEAEAKLEEYRGYFDFEGAVVHYAASTNVDFSVYGPETPIRYIDTHSGRGLLGMYAKEETGREWTLRDALAPAHGLGRARLFVGSGKTVADALDRWIDATGLDGLNILHMVSPDTFSDFITHVVPELRKLGRIRPDDGPTTLRSRMFGQESALPAAHHPAHRLARTPAVDRRDPAPSKGAAA
ncbi:5,10-methylene tetrahydromethanopterin reductase [Pararhizobium polonicum]|uniref:5,10-methylene tetrahydromethanopterin reductase n=1 Tax=Pararhizobium polonicum TaxID=1612624 RepID=A0A1C7NWQ6_9HYPH|nr:NtaA/DmoA family FMN-dependent monooxygenase [Pararhizobium polonicum]OBZ93412.1 5,10-methylene tetrahydromethanopterin reductase [Pararhizobium polonicum]